MRRYSETARERRMKVKEVILREAVRLAHVVQGPASEAKAASHLLNGAPFSSRYTG
jgi:hypothetical protein